MDAEEMFQWTKELKEIYNNIDKLKYIKVEVEYMDFENNNRERHLNRIKNLSPWQLCLIDEKIRREVGLK